MHDLNITKEAMAMGYFALIIAVYNVAKIPWMTCVRGIYTASPMCRCIGYRPIITSASKRQIKQWLLVHNLLGIANEVLIVLGSFDWWDQRDMKWWTLVLSILHGLWVLPQMGHFLHRDPGLAWTFNLIAIVGPIICTSAFAISQYHKWFYAYGIFMQLAPFGDIMLVIKAYVVSRCGTRKYLNPGNDLTTQYVSGKPYWYHAPCMTCTEETGVKCTCGLPCLAVAALCMKCAVHCPCPSCMAIKAQKTTALAKVIAMLKLCCGCCSLRPLINKIAKDIPCPPKYILTDEGEYKARDDYENAVCPVTGAAGHGHGASTKHQDVKKTVRDKDENKTVRDRYGNKDVHLETFNGGFCPVMSRYRRPDNFANGGDFDHYYPAWASQGEKGYALLLPPHIQNQTREKLEKRLRIQLRLVITKPPTICNQVMEKKFALAEVLKVHKLPKINEDPHNDLLSAKIEVVKAQMAARPAEEFIEFDSYNKRRDWVIETFGNAKVDDIKYKGQLGDTDNYKVMLATLEITQAEYDELVDTVGFKQLTTNREAKTREYPRLLPDPKAMFHEIMERKVDEKTHKALFTPVLNGNADAPNDQKFENINSLLPYLAVVVTHEFFRTDSGRGEDGDMVERDWINVNSSTLDLQGLYGITLAETRRIRTFENGKIFPDALMDNRLSRLKVVNSIYVLFNREHNEICDQLMQKYPLLFPDDESLFQQARLINTGVFMGCLLHDYVGGIMNFPGFVDTRVDNAPHPPATPMHCSLEFNLLYRFHSTIPPNFEMIPGKEGEDESYADFIHSTVEPKPLPSEAKGFVEDCLRRAIGEQSGAFVAHNVPAFLERFEVDAINLGRRYGVATFNDFRRANGMAPYSDFEQITDDKAVLASLRKHYVSVDDIELYVGITAEKYRPAGGAPGWGIPETLFTSIKHDALCSISYDRFQSTDFNIQNYTRWGYDRALHATLSDLIEKHTNLRFRRDDDDQVKFCMYVQEVDKNDAPVRLTVQPHVPVSSSNIPPIVQADQAYHTNDILIQNEDSEDYVISIRESKKQ